MSLINKMLQDLDKRHAADAGGKKTLTEQLRPVKKPMDKRRIAIEIIAGLLVGGGWALWVYYKIAPQSIVTDLAFQSRARRPPLAAPQPPAAGQTPPLVAAPSAQPAVAPTVPAPAASPPAAPAASAPVAAAAAVAPAAPVPASSEPARVDTLRLATEIGTPFSEKGTGARSRAERKPAAAAAPKVKTAAKEKPAAEPVAEAAQVPTEKADLGAPKARGPASIDKRAHVSTPAERAENEFRKATLLLNQGRVAEAIDGYKSSLTQDAGHVAARQALVGLLLENRRIDEAQQFLQEGLNLNPDRSSYAMLLSRIQVERGDLQGAHDLLARHAGSAANNADYHAFDAALLQRLGRHKEAVSSYQAALRIAPNAGVWWMGLGISLQADKRDAEARDAFKRAKSAGGLGPDLVSFIDQRLKQLQ